MTWGVSVLANNSKTYYNIQDKCIQAAHTIKLGDGACSESLKCGSRDKAIDHAHNGACHAFSAGVVFCCLEGPDDDTKRQNCIIEVCSKNFLATAGHCQKSGWAYPHVSEAVMGHFDDYNDVYVNTLKEKKHKAFIWEMRNRYVLREERIEFWIKRHFKNQNTEDETIKTLMNKFTIQKDINKKLLPFFKFVEDVNSDTNFILCDSDAINLEKLDVKDKKKDNLLKFCKEPTNLNHLKNFWLHADVKWVFLDRKNEKFETLKGKYKSLEVTSRFMLKCDTTIDNKGNEGLEKIGEAVSSSKLSVKKVPMIGTKVQFVPEAKRNLCPYRHIMKYQVKDLKKSTCIRVDFRYVNTLSQKEALLDQMFTVDDADIEKNRHIIGVVGIRKAQGKTGQANTVYDESYHYVPFWHDSKDKKYCMMDGFLADTPIWCANYVMSRQKQGSLTKELETGYFVMRDEEDANAGVNSIVAKTPWYYTSEGLGRIIACARDEHFPYLFFKPEKSLMWAHAERQDPWLREKTQRGSGTKIHLKQSWYPLIGVDGRGIDETENYCGGGGVCSPQNQDGSQKNDEVENDDGSFQKYAESEFKIKVENDDGSFQKYAESEFKIEDDVKEEDIEVWNGQVSETAFNTEVEKIIDLVIEFFPTSETHEIVEGDEEIIECVEKSKKKEEEENAVGKICLNKTESDLMFEEGKTMFTDQMEKLKNSIPPSIILKYADNIQSIVTTRFVKKKVWFHHGPYDENKKEHIDLFKYDINTHLAYEIKVAKKNKILKSKINDFFKKDDIKNDLKDKRKKWWKTYSDDAKDSTEGIEQNMFKPGMVANKRVQDFFHFLDQSFRDDERYNSILKPTDANDDDSILKPTDANDDEFYHLMVTRAFEALESKIYTITNVKTNEMFYCAADCYSEDCKIDGNSVFDKLGITTWNRNLRNKSRQEDALWKMNEQKRIMEQHMEQHTLQGVSMENLYSGPMEVTAAKAGNNHQFQEFKHMGKRAKRQQGLDKSSEAGLLPAIENNSMNKELNQKQGQKWQALGNQKRQALGKYGNMI